MAKSMKKENIDIELIKNNRLNHKQNKKPLKP